VRPGQFDQPQQVAAPQRLRHGRPGVVVNLLLDHRAVDVVRAEAQRNLRDFGVIMTQYALMCGTLSSIRRATAMFFRSSKPVVFGMCESAVLSG
jgi:hypothetical protein